MRIKGWTVFTIRFFTRNLYWKPSLLSEFQYKFLVNFFKIGNTVKAFAPMPGSDLSSTDGDRCAVDIPNPNSERSKNFVKK